MEISLHSGQFSLASSEMLTPTVPPTQGDRPDGVSFSRCWVILPEFMLAFFIDRLILIDQLIDWPARFI